MNLYSADSGSKWISTVQTRAPNESLLRRLGLQTNLYSADSGSKQISTVQTRAPNKSLQCRLGLQTNLYSADSGSKWISTVQTRAPNESLQSRLGLQTNLYRADSAPNYVIYSWWQRPYWDVWLHFSIVEGSGDRLSIFLQSMVEANDLTSCFSSLVTSHHWC